MKSKIKSEYFLNLKIYNEELQSNSKWFLPITSFIDIFTKIIYESHFKKFLQAYSTILAW